MKLCKKHSEVGPRSEGFRTNLAGIICGVVWIAAVASGCYAASTNGVFAATLSPKETPTIAPFIGREMAGHVQDAAEARVVAAFIRYGTATAPSRFASFRRRPVSFGPWLAHCGVKRESDGMIELSCTSLDHTVSVETLARSLRGAISPRLPRRLDRFACDSDSVGGYYLAWEHSYAYPLYVSAYVSSHDDHSYYIVTVAAPGQRTAVPKATLPPESSLNNCPWAR